MGKSCGGGGTPRSTESYPGGGTWVQSCGGGVSR